jgi:hypothetical protein
MVLIIPLAMLRAFDGNFHAERTYKFRLDLGGLKLRPAMNTPDQDTLVRAIEDARRSFLN